MDHQHDRTLNDKIDDNENELVVSKKVFFEKSNNDEIEQGNHLDMRELSITPVPESLDGNEELDDDEFDSTTNGHHQFGVDENIPQQTTSLNGSSSDDNGSSSIAATAVTPASTTTTTTTTTITQPITTTTITTGKGNERASPVNHQHTLRENQQLSERSSPVNGPGLAKPVNMTSSSKDSTNERSKSTTNSSTGKKRIDAALEKNIETIVTQVRRTTTKPSQLTENDLQLFDNTTSAPVIKNGHHSRETTPITLHSNHKQSSSSSREMTPDSINADSANEDQQQTVRNGHHYHRSVHPPTSNVDLTAPSISPYGPQAWPPAVYPFAHQHPGLYLPYPPTGTASTPTNGLPGFYPAYDPLIIEQHYGPQGLSAFYAQQQQQARLLQENPNFSGTIPTSTLFRESQSLTDIYNHTSNTMKLTNRLNIHLAEQQQQMMLSQIYLNQINSLPFVNFHDHTNVSRPCRSNGDILEHLSSSLTTPTKEPGENSPVGSGDSIRSSDSMNSGRRKKKTPSVSSQTHPSSNGSLTKLSPDRLSDGAANNDADSVVSFESQKSTSNSAMPVLEDGLSDSECISGDEESSPVKTKANGRHQSTQSDFLFDSTNHSPLITAAHKRQFAKSTSTMTNGVVDTSTSQAFYIRPPPPSSFVRPVNTTNANVNKSSTNLNQTKTPSEQTSTTTTTTTTPADETNSNANTNVKTSAKKDYDTDEETDKLLGLEHRIHAKNQAVRDAAISKPGIKSKSREENSSVLIEGVLFRCRYLGSTQLMVEGNPTKASRMMQAQEAVGRIKAPHGESQPSVEVDLFISTEKIMVLNTDLQDILMDHSLRSISYIADIGDLVVLMAKRRYLQHTDDNNNGHDDSPETTSTRRVVSINQKMICHVFESDEAQSIAHSIGQAFQVAYVEFLKANGIDDPSFTRDIDYQEVLNQQEIGNEELDRFSKKECQKEVIVPKSKNEPLGVVIVESGWGSMLPTVVIANMMPGGPAARCGHLNIGDQIISVNGISLVGLPLSSCQTQIKSVKHLTTVRLVVVPCPPVVEVLIRRPDTKYQLGFSVQNGIICSLLRGGIAERGGVRVGHRIIEINSQSVVATPHERIVSMLSNSVGELRMKTMPTQMYRLLTGQETPTYI